MSGLVRTYLGRTRLGRFFTVSTKDVLKLAGKADQGTITIKDLEGLNDRHIRATQTISNLIVNVLDPTVANKHNNPKVAGTAMQIKAFWEMVVDFRFQELQGKLEARTRAGKTTVSEMEELASFLEHFPHFGNKPQLATNIFQPIREQPAIFSEETRSLAQKICDQCLAWQTGPQKKPLPAAAGSSGRGNDRTFDDPILAAKCPRLFRMIQVNTRSGNREPERAFTEKKYDILEEIINESRKFVADECLKGHLPAEEYENIDQHLQAVLDELDSL